MLSGVLAVLLTCLLSDVAVAESKDWVIESRDAVTLGPGTPEEVYDAIEATVRGALKSKTCEEFFSWGETAREAVNLLPDIPKDVYPASAKVYDLQTCRGADDFIGGTNGALVLGPVVDSVFYTQCLRSILDDAGIAPAAENYFAREKKDVLETIRSAPKEECTWLHRPDNVREVGSCDSPPVVEPPTDEAELDAAATELRALAAELNRQMRKGHRHPAALFVVDGGCGAGEVTVRVETDPPGAELFYIPELYYRLCQKRHIDPMSDCYGWLPADAPIDIAGSYRYRAKLPDGRSAEGQFTLGADTMSKLEGAARAFKIKLAAKP